jgi:hypothetical protein
MSQIANLERLLDPEAAHRFWDSVDVTGPEECWLWISSTGVRERTGHVRIWHRGVRTYAHRVAFLLSGGQIGEGQMVLHSCDVPACCNPRHLRCGDAAANARDRDQRGRRTPYLPRGEAHWSSKLSNLDARRIRLARELGLHAEDVAAIFGVCRSSVYNVWSGVTYNHPAMGEETSGGREARDGPRGPHPVDGPLGWSRKETT